MYLLAFETSCDDTSVAILKDGELIAMATRTQMEHSVTGGVVPEVAARSHANAIFPCIQDVLEQTGLSLEDIDYIACTEKPGLLPSLLTGMTVAKSLALSLSKEIIWIDHIEAHIFANYLERLESEIVFPAMVLTVSGGHTEIYHWKSMFELERVGQTLDDAAGEAFDKVSKMMGLGFPGGARIAQLASENTEVYRGIFPVVLLDKHSLDFSFSGLKSAVKREVDNRMIHNSGVLALEDQREIAFEFEETMVNILSEKLIRSAEQFNIKNVYLAGGVSANTKLKSKIESICAKKGCMFLAPKKILYSMDNAAMVGIRAYYELIKNRKVTSQIVKKV